MKRKGRMIIWTLATVVASLVVYFFSVNVLGAPIIIWLVFSAAAPWIWPHRWLPLVILITVGEIATTMPPLTMTSMALIPYGLWLIRARIEPDISFSFGGWLALTLGAEIGIVFIVNLSSMVWWAEDLDGIWEMMPWLLMFKMWIFALLGSWVATIVSIEYLTNQRQ